MIRLLAQWSARALWISNICFQNGSFLTGCLMMSRKEKAGKDVIFLYSNPEQARALKKEIHLLPRQLQSTHKPNLEGSTCPVRYVPFSFLSFYSNRWERQDFLFSSTGLKLTTRRLPNRGTYLAHCITVDFTFLKSSHLSLWLWNHYYANDTGRATEVQLNRTTCHAHIKFLCCDLVSTGRQQYTWKQNWVQF